MKVEQISIFIENKSGRLAEVAEILANAGINIRALSLADTSDFGILRLIVDNPVKALEMLRDNSFTVSKTEVVGIEVPNQPGGLALILSILDKSQINVEYMYAFGERPGGNAIIIFRFDNIDEAISVLKNNGILVIACDVISGI
ncbi:ACT domain-containing protein [Geopsychrobacter electrodiphilus]|uniref:ACT domain-containing protein n=1 Tax=Geopsychrobacter electrodiphilus TaxID=225196 RepID=UPI00037BB19E